MTLYTDIPTRAEIDALWNAAFPTPVSLYVPTEPASSGEAEQIAFKNLARAALDQLAGADKNDLAAVEEALADLGEDDGFWRRQARTLAVFATPAWLRTFRLPNRLIELAVGGERLHVKPLMRAVTFPQTAFVLALAQGGVRLLETVPDAPPALVRVPDMPSDVATAAGKASIKDRAPIRRLQGDEGQKVRIRQYARRVDHALREVLPGQGVPLVIAATEPLDSIFRSVCRYPDVVPESVRGNPESVSDVELVQQARAVLDRYYAGKLAELHALFERRAGQNRTSSDVATVARLVTQGAVDTLFVDVDGVVLGEVDEDGAVRFGDEQVPGSIGVVDEITRRGWLSGARLLAVRRGDVPGGPRPRSHPALRHLSRYRSGHPTRGARPGRLFLGISTATDQRRMSRHEAGRQPQACRPIPSWSAPQVESTSQGGSRARPLAGPQARSSTSAARSWYDRPRPSGSSPRGNGRSPTLSAWCEDPAHTGLAEGPPEVSNQRRESQMPDGRKSSLWAAGAILFAGIMMIVVGIWEALEGLIAIFEDEFYVATRRYLFQFDVTAWGWIHVILGLVLAYAGYGLLTGRTWARVVAITLAALSAIANFLWLPYYPFWALLIISVDVFVIWAVAVHGREVSI